MTYLVECHDNLSFHDDYRRASQRFDREIHRIANEGGWCRLVRWEPDGDEFVCGYERKVKAA